MSENTDIDRRVALVTGAARGIGAAIAAGLAEDGLAVAVADLNLDQATETAEAIVAAGGAAIAVEVDITDSGKVNACVELVAADLGPVDVLVNNAGWDELIPFLKTEEEFWEKVVDINYLGALRMVKACAPGMVEKGGGRIINIASDAGRVGSSMEAVYSGAKGGIIAFTKTLARELARKGVTANSVCPGPTNTPMLQDVVRKSPGDADKVIGAMTAGVPMKRLAEPHEIAVGVRFFAREDAGYVTGQTLSVSGGLTMA